ncbi:hypothetical protein [Rhizobium sp. Root708]|uniref:hypothetical protein n=1 Tax=Rhizobium sp. Root708 TaxID=1736592 RepID=UPI0012E33074|nr:hypothetical protein [Rhizobium sp. Root708]
MRFEGRAIIDQPLHALYCHIPFNAIIDVVGAEFWGRTSALSYSPGQGFEDATIRNLLLSVSQAIHSCSRDRHLYLDHVAVALVAHLVAVRGDALSRRFAA